METNDIYLIDEHSEINMGPSWQIDNNAGTFRWFEPTESLLTISGPLIDAYPEMTQMMSGIVEYYKQQYIKSKEVI